MPVPFCSWFFCFAFPLPANRQQSQQPRHIEATRQSANRRRTAIENPADARALALHKQNKNRASKVNNTSY